MICSVRNVRTHAVPPPYAWCDLPCDDGNACIVDVCVGDEVRDHDTEIDCDDGDPCTIDDCDNVTGCTHVSICPPDDEDPCTELACIDFFGEWICDNWPDDCDDGDPCTDDSCDPVVGCVNDPIECTPSGDPCLIDCCQGGACVSNAPAQPCNVVLGGGGACAGDTAGVDVVATLTNTGQCSATYDWELNGPGIATQNGSQQVSPGAPVDININIQIPSGAAPGPLLITFTATNTTEPCVSVTQCTDDALINVWESDCCPDACVPECDDYDAKCEAECIGYDPNNPCCDDPCGSLSTDRDAQCAFDCADNNQCCQDPNSVCPENIFVGSPACPLVYKGWTTEQFVINDTVRPIDPDNCGCTTLAPAVVITVGTLGIPGEPVEEEDGYCEGDPANSFCARCEVTGEEYMIVSKTNNDQPDPTTMFSGTDWQGDCETTADQTLWKDKSLVQVFGATNWGREHGNDAIRTAELSDLNPEWTCYDFDYCGENCDGKVGYEPGDSFVDPPPTIRIQACPKQGASGFGPRLFGLPGISEACCSALPSLSLGNLYFRAANGTGAARGGAMQYFHFASRGVDPADDTTFSFAAVQIPGLVEVANSALVNMAEPWGFVLDDAAVPVTGTATDIRKYTYEYSTPDGGAATLEGFSGYVIPLSSVKDEAANEIRIYDSEEAISYPTATGVYRITKQHSLDGAQWIDYTYDTLDRLTSVASSTGRTLNLLYDDFFRLMQYSTGDGACGSCGGGQQLEYVGSTNFVSKRSDLSGKVLGAYEYDGTGRLTKLSRGDAGSLTVVQEVFYTATPNDETVEYRNYVDGSNYEKLVKVDLLDANGDYTGASTETVYTGMNGLGTACTTTSSLDYTSSPVGTLNVTQYPEGGYFVQILGPTGNVFQSYRTTDPGPNLQIEKMKEYFFYEEFECDGSGVCTPYIIASENMYGGLTEYV